MADLIWGTIMLRRELLASIAGFGVLGAAKFTPASAAPAGDLTKVLDAIFESDLETSPEHATELGLDTGARARLKSQLTDVSQAGLAARRAKNNDHLKQMKAISRSGLTDGERVSYDTVMFVLKSYGDILRFDFVGLDGFSPSPYVISPITGAYQRIPSFLDTKHRIDDADGAESYLVRMTAFGTALRANTERFSAEVANGIMQPDFLLDTTISQLTALNVAADQSGLVRSLARRVAQKGLDARFQSRAEEIYTSAIQPAFSAQIEAVKTARARAGHDPGVWRYKEGEAFYRANLRYTTTTDLSPDEIHKIGLDQAREIGARLDQLLKAQGLTQGSVGARVQSLYHDPAQLYPDTPAGKEKLIADLQARIDAIRPLLPKMFKRLPTQAIEVRAVPPEIDAGAPLAYSERPALDGSRPGYVYFNLHDIHEWPRFDLPSTLYHEALPGHQLQGGVAMQNQNAPLLVRNYYFSGYGEGWALYAEQLADELGVYDDDPLGRIGYLKAQIFRAGRLVVDTGMHHKRWSREQAIQYLMDLDGDAVGSTTREVDRYVAIPGQACSYKLGHTTWNKLRDQTNRALGARFDIRDFHDMALATGAVPLAVLETMIADYIRKNKA